MANDEPELVNIRITKADDGQWHMQPGEVVSASEAWKIGLSAADVRWLLGIPDPPRKPPSYRTLLRRCIHERCTFIPGIAEGWEVCLMHGTVRKKEAS